MLRGITDLGDILHEKMAHVVVLMNGHLYWGNDKLAVKDDPTISELRERLDHGLLYEFVQRDLQRLEAWVATTHANATIIKSLVGYFPEEPQGSVAGLRGGLVPVRIPSEKLIFQRGDEPELFRLQLGEESGIMVPAAELRYICGVAGTVSGKSVLDVEYELEGLLRDPRVQMFMDLESPATVRFAVDWVVKAAFQLPELLRGLWTSGQNLITGN